MAARYDLLQSFVDRFTARVFGRGAPPPPPAPEKTGNEISLAALANRAPVPSAVAATARKPCPALWKTPVIRWDGQIHVCCADLDGKIKVGNIREKSIKELWEGPDVTRYRLLHIEGRFDEMPMCGPCAGFNWYDMTPGEIETHSFTTNHRKKK